MKRYAMMIDGNWEEPASGQWIDSVEPYSGDVFAQISRGDAADADRAVQSAHAAFKNPAWSEMTATARGGLLRKLGDLIERDAQRLADIERSCNGKNITEVLGQVKNVAQWFYYYAGLADKIHGAVVPINKAGVFNYIRYEPLGVVVAITPWNSPLALTSWKIAPALACGNTIVVKPSEYTSPPLLELAALALEAGFPKGVFNVVTGFGNEIGAALIDHKLVAKVAFTGGDQGGQKVAEAAARHFKKVTLELGGKSANIVFADADFDQAIKGAIAGIFGAAGQTCMAGSRLLLERSIHDKFVARMVELVEAAHIGNPADEQTQVGPIATKAQFQKILDYIEIAKGEGATCVTGGHALTGEQYGQGQFIAPTIFTNTNNAMRICQEEVFGPVLAVMPFDTLEEALEIANDSDFGLAAAVWTTDLHKAIYCSDRLEAGTVWVNNYRATSFTTPFGGYKRSGMGREGGIEGAREYLQAKSVWITTQPNRSNPFVLG